MTNWFERLTGFREGDYESTQRQLRVEGDELVSEVNGRRYGIGSLTLPTLGQLRDRVNPERGERSSLGVVVGDARKLHAEGEFGGALFQVASQFNLLEMISPEVTPEEGVGRYANDPTQGPACAMAAGAATIYRNYLVPIDGAIGQRADRQLDALSDLGSQLAGLLGIPVDSLWRMQNGYALLARDRLSAICQFLDGASADEHDDLRSRLAIGLHSNVEVTDQAGEQQTVSQAFCSALPVAYHPFPQSAWVPFAQLVLEAAYEATLLAATEQASAGGSNTVLLTRLGGGAFGNADEWIDRSIERALRVVENAGLDIRIVSFGAVSTEIDALVRRWAQS